METPSEAQKFDTVMRKILSVSKKELQKREKAWKRKRERAKKKAGDFLARLPRLCRRVAHRWVVLAQFGLPVS